MLSLTMLFFFPILPLVTNSAPPLSTDPLLLSTQPTVYFHVCICNDPMSFIRITCMGKRLFIHAWAPCQWAVPETLMWWEVGRGGSQETSGHPALPNEGYWPSWPTLLQMPGYSSNIKFGGI